MINFLYEMTIDNGNPSFFINLVFVKNSSFQAVQVNLIYIIVAQQITLGSNIQKIPVFWLFVFQIFFSKQISGTYIPFMKTAFFEEPLHVHAESVSSVPRQ